MSRGPSVARVGVIGAGFMGSGIAESAALGTRRASGAGVRARLTA
jgi:3-hydroxyacyl-CoA dehydrogenase